MTKKNSLLYHIYIIMCMALLLAALPMRAARWQKPAFYSRFENYSTAKLYAMGDDYLNKQEKADSALVCFTIIANRMDDGQLKESEYETAVKALNLMGNIYSSYFSRFDLADDCLTSAQELAEKYGFTHQIPYILGNKGNVTYLSEAINDEEKAKREYIQEEKKVFAEAVKVKEWRCVCVAYYNIALFTLTDMGGDGNQINHETDVFGRLKIPKGTHFDNIAKIYYRLINLWKRKDYKGYAQLLEQSIPGQDLYTQMAVVPMMRVQLALVYHRMGEEGKARQQVQLLEQKAEESHSPVMLYQVYDMLTKYWQQAGNSEMMKHYDYLRLLTKEKLNQESKLSQVQQSRFVRQLNQVSDQLRMETAKKRASQRFTIIVSIALVVILIMIIVLWRMYRRQGRYVDLLYQRNQQLIKGNQLLLPEKKDNDSGTELPAGIIEAIERVMQDTPTVCSHDFSMARLCDLSGYSRTYVSQAIRRHYGTNFNGLLNSYRIREACRRLADREHYANLTIEAIADSLGYASRSNFSQVFKRVTGLSASEYQKKATESHD